MEKFEKLDEISKMDDEEISTEKQEIEEYNK